MAYEMVATAVSLNDLEGHSRLTDVSKCNPSNICVAFYMISTDLCSHDSSALAELLVGNRLYYIDFSTIRWYTLWSKVMSEWQFWLRCECAGDAEVSAM